VGPLAGIRALELGQWYAGPVAGALLADWGADVVKVEPPEGDPLRAMLVAVFPRIHQENPLFEQVNRGKRSVAIDLRREGGRRVFLDLVRRADVLVTNLRPYALREMGATYEDLAPHNPSLIYCQVTGYGHDHPASNRALLDVGVYARIGMARLVTAAADPEGEPPQEPNAVFDTATGMAAAGAVCAALWERERTGRGRWIGVSLVRTAAFLINWDILRATRLGTRVRPVSRRQVRNPLINCYRTGDGRWLWLLGLQPDRQWPALCRALGRDDLLHDPRFADITSRARHAQELVDTLDRVFAQRPLEEWAPILEGHGVWWEPVQSVNEAAVDPLVRQAGVFRPVSGETGELIAGPVDFTAMAPLRPAPELGQHTEEVLLELGYTWERIIQLKEEKAIIA